MAIKQHDQKRIIQYINEFFCEESISLSDYLCNYSSLIISELKLPFEPDYFYFSIGDINSKDYIQFVELMKKVINSNTYTSKIVLTHNYGEDLLSKSKYGENIDSGIKNNLMQRIININKLSNAPTIYENICGEFLKDCGFNNVVVTRSTTDFGIDIIAEYNFQPPHLILPYKFNILAQVKYFNNQIDTSYIRKIIGDSVFIRFDSNIYPNVTHEPLCLYVFGHSGFTKDARKFAKSNGVYLVDTNNMCDYISSVDRPQSSYIYKYLQNIYKDTI